MDLVQHGNAMRRAGNFERAEESYRHATRIDPAYTDAWAELGCLMLDCRHFSEATVCFFRVLEQDAHPGSGDSANLAIQLLDEIVKSRPRWARAQFSLGCAYEHLHDFARARAHLAVALELDPEREAPVQSIYARMLYLEKNCSAALTAANRALAARPDYFLAHVIRGKSCAELGEWVEAARSLRRVIEIQPHEQFHSDLLFHMNYLVDTTPQTLYQEACRWSALYAAPLMKRARSPVNTPDPHRRIKVGYVSPDLHSHPVTKFAIPVLERHDRSQVEVFVYAVGLKADNVTDWIRERVEHFVSLRGAGIELADRVRADGIDILVDLAGHTMGSAYLAFATKPAPIQVSWLGVLSTTGMSTIDYFLGDQWLPCPGTENLFTEKIYRLPKSICCYRPTDNVPVVPAPCLQRGYITFGCYNNPRKVNRDVVKLWSALLHLVPQSRLVLKWAGLNEGVKHDRLSSWFVEDGIPVERVRFESGSTPTKYLEDYGDIDIALDPFPYHGGSTTLDALWMGVPVVTLAGRLAVQRTGVSLLSAVGLAGMVAESPEQYLNIALFLAEALPQIPDYRINLRQALQSSALMDESGHVRDVEAAYREMWRTWCASQLAARVPGSTE